MTSPHNTLSKMRLYEMFAPKSFSNLASPIGMQPSTPTGLTMTASINDILKSKLYELDKLIAQATDIQKIDESMQRLGILVETSSSPYESLLLLVEMVVYNLYKSTAPFAIEAYVTFLTFLQRLSYQSANVVDEAMNWVVYTTDERKYNAPVVATLIRYKLLPLEEYDINLARAIRDRPNTVVDFAANLIRICLFSQQPITFLEDHALTIIALNRLPIATDPYTRILMEDLKLLAESSYPKEKLPIDCLKSRLLFAEWTRLCEHPLTSELHYVRLLRKIRALATDDDSMCFILRVYTEICLSQYRPRLSRNSSLLVIRQVDALAKLISYLIMTEKSAKIKLANHALSVIVLVLAQHHEIMMDNFNQKPFLALLSSLLGELSRAHVSKAVDLGILIAFCDTLYTLQPSRFPGFALSWLQLVSHRLIVHQLLVVHDLKGVPIYQKLVMALLKFLGPLLSCRPLSDSSERFYKGTLRFLVVLLHDFPEFLCENYMIFGQAIPLRYVQLRNMILSAFPRTMQLPDPLAVDAGLDLLPDSRELPTVASSYCELLIEPRLKAKVDDYIRCDTETFLKEALTLVQEDPEEDTYREDIMGALVYYIGSEVASADTPYNANDNPALRIYKYLLAHMSSKGTYLLLNALTDHLRYPNRHTSFFHFALRNLFASQPEFVKERITRVMLERLIVNRPHPWGLLATFITLLKDPKFDEHEFVRCHPEIENLFENVKRTIRC